MREAVELFDPAGKAVPYCMPGGTDAKQFSRLGITGYGFSPLKLPEGFDYPALFHGVDERVPADALHFGVRVLDHFVRNSGGPGAHPHAASRHGGTATPSRTRTSGAREE
jgi:acetylornithine deacetylase/succinyl-diaminopimelate desuccinylase-like protein